MGTLTGDCPVLDSHCPHKLATSCRLTSTTNCCACADERPHTLTYRVYIDGVGFVNRGKRWQGYCWFCKEFWNNRLEATDPPLQLSQTRVPLIPDQTEFLEKWFEFHRGYRIAKLADGSEQRIAVTGEPWKEVSPGFLPRTLDEMRNRRENNALRPANRFRRRRLSSEDVEQDQQPQQSLEDALDDLLKEDSDEEIDTGHAEVSDPSLATLTVLDNASSLPIPTNPVPQAVGPSSSREERARERFTRLFGSREDVEQDDYVSPLTTMYQRAWTRHQEAEHLRDTGERDAPPLNTLSAEERHRVEQQILWGVMVNSLPPMPSDSSADVETALRLATNLINESSPQEPERNLDMDKQDRPPPMDEKDMIKKLACSICYSQLADTALLPCGHMIMCRFCADLHVPVKHSHIPVRESNCPKCRKRIKQRFRIHM